jgi:hypothetical protein
VNEKLRELARKQVVNHGDTSDRAPHPIIGFSLLGEDLRFVATSERSAQAFEQSLLLSMESLLEEAYRLGRRDAGKK